MLIMHAGSTVVVPWRDLRLARLEGNTAIEHHAERRSYEGQTHLETHRPESKKMASAESNEGASKLAAITAAACGNTPPEGETEGMNSYIRARILLLVSAAIVLTDYGCVRRTVPTINVTEFESAVRLSGNQLLGTLQIKSDAPEPPATAV